MRGKKRNKADGRNDQVSDGRVLIQTINRMTKLTSKREECNRLLNSVSVQFLIRFVPQRSEVLSRCCKSLEYEIMKSIGSELI